MPDEVRAEVDNAIEAGLKRAVRSDKAKLAMAARILAANGHASSLAGQLTVRAEPNGWWTPPLGEGFEEASEETLLRVDEDIRTVEGKGIPNPAVRFHVWIYRVRPDAHCIVHTHPPAASALSMIGRPLVCSHMDAMMLYEDCAWLPEWPGVPVADEEGRIISEALCDRSAILLAHHGLLTVGKSVEEATYLAYNFELAARLQLDAESAGTVLSVEPAHGLEARRFLRQDAIVGATFDRLARRYG
ncbi:MAG: aldolase [Alphaproteobacteria bacterium]|nr:aldolase [Alphaproteobacteria bacterium]